MGAGHIQKNVGCWPKATTNSHSPRSAARHNSRHPSQRAGVLEAVLLLECLLGAIGDKHALFAKWPSACNPCGGMVLFLLRASNVPCPFFTFFTPLATPPTEWFSFLPVTSTYRAHCHVLYSTGRDKCVSPPKTSLPPPSSRVRGLGCLLLG